MLSPLIVLNKFEIIVTKALIRLVAYLVHSCRYDGNQPQALSVEINSFPLGSLAAIYIDKTIYKEKQSYSSVQ